VASTVGLTSTVAMYCRKRAWWFGVLGEVDLVGLKPILRTTTSLSALTLSVGSFDP